MSTTDHTPGDSKLPRPLVTTSPLSPFRHLAFTVLWIATVVSNIGTWMQAAAAAWLMTHLNPDPLVVALVQVAAALPMFIFALPAGALADIVDRRKLLIGTQAATVLLATLFGVLVWLERVTPASLLLLALSARRLCGTHRAHMAIDRAAARAEAGPAAGGRPQQRRLQCQPRGWPGARGRHHRSLESRGSVLDQCGRPPLA